MRRLPIEERFWPHVRKSDGCWTWTSTTLRGYGVITHGVGRRNLPAHRASWELHHGPITGNLRVLHACDNPPCVRPDHLFLGTDADNVRDMVGKDRQAKGERHGRRKLTDDEVVAIRRERLGGATLAALGAKHGVSEGQVSRIVRGLSR